MNLADLGLMSVGFAPMHVGYTAPTISYDKMRQIQASAGALDVDISTYVQRQAFKDAWADWYRRWREFYDKYELDKPGVYNAAKIEVVTRTDEFAAQVEGWRKQFSGFFDAYQIEAPGKRPTGQIVPEPPPPAPTPTPSDPWTVISWWKIGLVSLGVLVVGGTMYSFYRTAKREKAKHEAFIDRLPQLFPGDLGQIAHAVHTAHDCPLGVHRSSTIVDRPIGDV